MTKAFMMLGLLLSATALAQAPIPLGALPSSLQNGGFLEGDLGQAPKGWLMPKPSQEAGYRAQIAEDPSLPGKRCVHLHQEGPSTHAFGNLMQNVDATPFRGKRIRLRGQLRFDAKEASSRGAQMWLRVDLPGQKMGFFDNMQNRPVKSSKWTAVEIVGDVAPDAEQLAFGNMLTRGGGNLWIAPMALEILGDTPAIAKEVARPLTTQGRINLEAFTRTFNYVRFFHPSDAAVKADWERLAIEGVRRVEDAPSTPELAKRLQQFFEPYAPSAQFLAAGQEAKLPQIPTGAVYAVRWSHLGFGQNHPESIYKSTREYLPCGEAVTKGWAKPHSPATLKIAADLKLWLPAVIYADKNRATLPKAPVTAAAEQTPKLPEPTVGAMSGDDRATRLAGVVLTWGIFQHFYPYFDVVKTDWNAELPKALSAAAEDPDAEAFTHTLRRMTAPLKDGHVNVQDLTRRGRAIPLEVGMVEGTPVVLHAPASLPTLVAGSRILSVDGEASEVRIARLQKEISAATPGWMNAMLADEFLLGEPGTRVKLIYQTPEGTRGEATLVRNLAPQESRQHEKVAELKPGLWYVDLDRISRKDFQEVLPKLAQARGLIFDLRGYPKLEPVFLEHITPKLVECARWNIPIITQPDGQGWDWNKSRWDLKPKKPRITGKVAFLTGGAAISYAETCLGIVEAYRLAEIVGEPTAGTNGNINPFTLPGGYSVSWTGMKVLKHDGSVHHGVGIQPTVPVKPTIQGIAAERDEVLEKAIEVVSR